MADIVDRELFTYMAADIAGCFKNQFIMAVFATDIAVKAIVCPRVIFRINLKDNIPEQMLAIAPRTSVVKTDQFFICEQISSEMPAVCRFKFSERKVQGIGTFTVRTEFDVNKNDRFKYGTGKSDIIG